ncbi:MAG TPA: hypothetical protein VFX25_15220 [Streptosporangiaceae bacterium]|nr:hypothetical protein [Streptosporangiaceae bacterium]
MATGAGPRPGQARAGARPGIDRGLGLARPGRVGTALGLGRSRARTAAGDRDQDRARD